MTRIFLEKTVHRWYYYFVKCEVILFSKGGYCHDFDGCETK